MSVLARRRSNSETRLWLTPEGRKTLLFGFGSHKELSIPRTSSEPPPPPPDGNVTQVGAPRRRGNAQEAQAPEDNPSFDENGSGDESGEFGLVDQLDKQVYTDNVDDDSYSHTSSKAGYSPPLSTSAFVPLRCPGSGPQAARTGNSNETKQAVFVDGSCVASTSLPSSSTTACVKTSACGLPRPFPVCSYELAGSTTAPSAVRTLQHRVTGAQGLLEQDSNYSPEAATCEYKSMNFSWDSVSCAAARRVALRKCKIQPEEASQPSWQVARGTELRDVQGKGPREDPKPVLDALASPSSPATSSTSSASPGITPLEGPEKRHLRRRSFSFSKAGDLDLALSQAENADNGGSSWKKTSTVGNKKDFLVFTVGDYTLSASLGGGGGGKVYLGRHAKTKKQVAVKVCSRLTQEAYLRAKKEAEIMTQLKHKHIVELEEVIENEHRVCMVMTYAQNGDLFNYVRNYDDVQRELARKGSSPASPTPMTLSSPHMPRGLSSSPRTEPQPQHSTGFSSPMQCSPSSSRSPSPSASTTTATTSSYTSTDVPVALFTSTLSTGCLIRPRKPTPLIPTLPLNALLSSKQSIDAPISNKTASSNTGSASPRSDCYYLNGNCINLTPRRADKSKRLPEFEAWRIFRQLVSAVVYLHSKGFVHRDLKLENVFLDADHNVLLGDFGLADGWSSLSRKNYSCGSCPYTSPEMLFNTSYIGPEVDMWALGVILYFMITGKFPFGDGNSSANSLRVAEKVKKGQWKKTRRINDNPALASLLSLLFEPNPLRRATTFDVTQHPWFRTRPAPASAPFERSMTTPPTSPDRNRVSTSSPSVGLNARPSSPTTATTTAMATTIAATVAAASSSSPRASPLSARKEQGSVQSPRGGKRSPSGSRITPRASSRNLLSSIAEE